MCLKHYGFTYAASLLILTSAVSRLCAQEKSPSAEKTTKLGAILVDTDDPCRLFLDGQDQGMIQPDNAKKVRTSIGNHIVKCTVDGIPDLTWRKVVGVKDLDQVAILVSLKALHIQYAEASAQLEKSKQSEGLRAIQDWMNGQGGLTFIRNAEHIDYKISYLISDVSADPDTCRLSVTATLSRIIEPNPGWNKVENGKIVTGDDLRSTVTEISTTPVNDIQAVAVDTLQECYNNANPSVTHTISPPMFCLTILTSKPSIRTQSSERIGNGAPLDSAKTEARTRYIFRDKTNADRVALALRDATKDCGSDKK